MPTTSAKVCKNNNNDKKLSCR